MLMTSILMTTSSGAAQSDAIDLTGATIERSAGDVASWPVTANITKLVLGASDCAVEFDKQSTWPNVAIPGWNGGSIQYTLWLVRIVNGQVYTGGGIEFWQGRVGGCGPAAGYIANWYYDSSWGQLHDAGDLTPGEKVGFFVTAGDARAKDIRTVTERSVVVSLPWPGGSGGTFEFTPTTIPTIIIPPVVVPPPPPPPIVVVPPPPVVQPIPSTDLNPVMLELFKVSAQIEALDADVQAFKSEVESKWKQYAGPILKYGAAILAGILAKWKL